MDILIQQLEKLTNTQLAVILVALVWDLVWRGMALWKSGGNKQLGWFIALLIANSVGILPLVYLSWFQKEKD